MADFCKQCSIKMFGEDTHDLAKLVKEGEFIETICEGCGHTIVDYKGECVWKNCPEKHGGTRLKNQELTNEQR